MNPVSFATLAPNVAPAIVPKPPTSLKPVPPGRMQVHAGDFVKQRIGMKNAFIKVRGFDLGNNQKRVPRTTIGDVLKIAEYWSDSLRLYGRARSQSDRTTLRRWLQYIKKIKTIAAKNSANTLYPDNERFWEQEISRVAIWLRSLKELPKPWVYAWEAVHEAWDEAPETLARWGRKLGRILFSPFAGAKDALGIDLETLIIGAAVVTAGIVAINVSK